jgi:hypothetical protein
MPVVFMRRIEPASAEAPPGGDAYRWGMDVEYPGFGVVVVEGERHERDVIIDGGVVRSRDKKPSRFRRDEFGHTPLTALEDLPWSGERLIVGTGYSGRLPVTSDVAEEARRRGVDLVQAPTSEACELIREIDPTEVFALLHLTC